MKKQFTEEQIIKVLKEYEGGKRAADIVREHGISEQTFYRWKTKFGGMDVSEAKRLRQLEEENRRLNILNVRKQRAGHPLETSSAYFTLFS